MLLALVVEHPLVRASWNEMLDALDAVTPLVEDTRPGLAFLEMRGIAGDFATWMAQVRRVLARFAMPLRLGGGPNKCCAYAATWIADATLIAPGVEAAMLAPLPLEVLDLDEETRERLHVLGIETLGALAALPHGPFVRRFGRDAARWHECARGIDRTPFHPRAQAIAIDAALFGEGRIEEESQMFFALRVLLARICEDLERCGRRPGALRVDVELDDGTTSGFECVLSAPTANERALFELIRAKFEGMTFPAPVVGVRVQALRLEEGGEALPLLVADEIDDQEVTLTLARVEAVLGEPVLCARMRPAHALEECFEYEPFALAQRVPMKASAPTALPADLVPQLRLLTVREVSVRMVNGEPAFVGTPPRAVVECAGPWRVEEGWFATSPVARDEYDLLLEDGELCRIYRQGRRWYRRGVYD